VTRKRTKAAPEAEAPITGVAAGSLGTAANLDDTQVLRTEDLEAAATGRVGEDAPEIGAAAHGRVGEDAPALATEPVVAARPPTSAHRPTGAAGAAAPIWGRRSAPALAGVAALLVLLLIAGSGFVSQLDLGIGAGPAEPGASAGALVEAAPSPTAEPKAGKGGHGKCHGRGHNCQGNED